MRLGRSLGRTGSLVLDGLIVSFRALLASPSLASVKLYNHGPGDEVVLCELEFEELSCP